MALVTPAIEGVTHRTSWAREEWGFPILDFWDDFTLDGGVRYNWERKTGRFKILSGFGATGGGTSLVNATRESLEDQLGSERCAELRESGSLQPVATVVSRARAALLGLTADA